MGLLDVLNGMQHGPHGSSTPSSQSSGGMSPMTMAILALLAWKTVKHFTAPGAVKCLTAFQASNAMMAMVIGDMPPLDCELGLEEPRGPCCMPLSTSSKPMLTLRCPRRAANLNDGS